MHTDIQTREQYSTDASIFKIIPECVVFPKNKEDLRKLIAFANANAGEVSLSARGAGTGMSGGSLTESVVVDFTKHFNKIHEVNDEFARVDAGVFYRDLEKETLKRKRILPCYTASKDLNTIGGMIANNSGGEKSLTYGKMERYVSEVKMMLSDGKEYTFKPLSGKLWHEKAEFRGIEGDVYRRINEILDNNKATISNAKPKVSKNSAGYNLWNIYDEKEDVYDITQLLVGSQGTLGFVTEVVVRLVPTKPLSRLLVMFLRKKDMDELGDIVNTTLAHKPESFESYDDHTFKIVLKVIPSLVKKMGGNIFRLAWSFLPEAKMILTGGIPKLVLLAEFTGSSIDEIEDAITEAHNDLVQRYEISIHKTKSEHENKKYWIIRRESFNLLRKKVGKKHTAPFIDDVSVAPEYLPEFLPKLYEILDEYNITYTIAGHVGDGNFHIIPLMNYKRKDFLPLIEEISQKVYDLVAKYHGSLTGEHNDGLIRTQYLGKMFDTDTLELFVEVKNIFDPLRIFNPHKKVEADTSHLEDLIKNI